MKVDLIIGTRPEAIKLSPVARIMRNYPGFEPRVILTGQHEEMVEDLPEFFDVPVHNRMKCMSAGQSLNSLSSKLLLSLETHFKDDRPDVVLVQGDTTSAFMGALAAYYAQIPVCHVEAGLRTNDIYSPFPEEVNRAAIARIARLHFAPTEQAMSVLKKEGVEGVHLVGNTVIDAAKFAQMRTQTVPEHMPFQTSAERKTVLITAHRRETLGNGLKAICTAIATLHEQHEALDFVFPMHLNPAIRTLVQQELGALERVQLCEPLSYPQMITAMDQAWLLLTDSGGLQEEAPSFDLPVLVLREKSERMEGVEAGGALLCGTATDAIMREVERLITTPTAYDAMAKAINPYGDGKAAMRITEIIKHTFSTHQEIA